MNGGLRHRALGTSKGTGGFRVEAVIFLGCGGFFLLVLGLYWFASYESGGAVLLLFTACLGLLPGSYLFWWSRRMRPRPSDRTNATREEGAGSVASFPDSSMWPLMMGVGAAFIALALAFSPWLAVIGGMLAVITLAGVVAESRRGGTVP